MFAYVLGCSLPGAFITHTEEEASEAAEVTDHCKILPQRQVDMHMLSCFPEGLVIATRSGFSRSMESS